MSPVTRFQPALRLNTDVTKHWFSLQNLLGSGSIFQLYEKVLEELLHCNECLSGPVPDFFIAIFSSPLTA